MAEEIALGSGAFLGDGELQSTGGFGARLRRMVTLARQNPLGALGLVIIIAFIFIAIFAPSPFVFGAVVGMLAMLLIKAFWLARTPRDSREHSQIGSSA